MELDANDIIKMVTTIRIAIIINILKIAIISTTIIISPCCTQSMFIKYT